MRFQSSFMLITTQFLLLAPLRDHNVAGAALLALPTMYSWREYVDANGLMSYGASLFDQYRLAASMLAAFSRASKLPICP